MAGFLQRGLLLYLLIAIIMVFAAPQYVFSGNTPADKTVLAWFDMTYDNNTGSVSMGGNFSSSQYGTAYGTMNDPTSPAGANGILGFIDVFYQVFDWVKLFFKVIFSPILLFTNVGMPTPIILILAVPLVLLFILGIIGWIRSGII